MKKLIISSALFFIYLLFGLFTWGNHTWLLFFTLSSNFVLSYFIFKKNINDEKVKLGLLINLPLILLMFLTCIFYKDFSRGLLYIIFIPISSYLAYLFLLKKKNIIPVFSIILFAFVGFFIFPNFFAFYKNTNSTRNVKFPNITFVNKENKIVNLTGNKVIVLDFWSTDCGICFKKFPDLEDVYLKYKGNKNVEIYSVHVPYRGDTFSNTIKILDSIGYKFPKIYAKSSKVIKDSLSINSFPHLLIIKNGEIRYEGMLETKKTVYMYNIEDEIDKLLYEK